MGFMCRKRMAEKRVLRCGSEAFGFRFRSGAGDWGLGIRERSVSIGVALSLSKRGAAHRVPFDKLKVTLPA